MAVRASNRKDMGAEVAGWRGLKDALCSMRASPQGVCSPGKAESQQRSGLNLLRVLLTSAPNKAIWCLRPRKQPDLPQFPEHRWCVRLHLFRKTAQIVLNRVARLPLN